MSFTTINAKPSDTMASHQDTMGVQAEEGKPTYKSFKKKFRKMKHRFDAAMQQSNEVFLQEQHAMKTAKRLAQENDQILDLLLDVNNSAQIPVDKRIDITSEAPGLSPLPSLVSDDDLASIGTLQTPEGQALMAELRTMFAEKAASNNAILPPKSLNHLINTTPHLPLDHPTARELLTSLEPEPNQTVPYSYLTPDQLDDYLYDIDASLGTVPPLPPQFHPPIQQDLAFGNPNSPYNWLRKNQPHIFLQDGEGSEKSHGKPGALRGAGKRASIPAPSKPDALEIVEEDGQGYDFALGGGASTKGKRKRDEDDGSGGYHPKSGRFDEVKAKKPRANAKKRKSDGAGLDDGEEKVKKEKPAPKRPRKAKIPSPDPGAHPFGPILR